MFQLERGEFHKGILPRRRAVGDARRGCLGARIPRACDKPLIYIVYFRRGRFHIVLDPPEFIVLRIGRRFEHLNRERFGLQAADRLIMHLHNARRFRMVIVQDVERLDDFF